jgi:hypothetical protein
MVTKLFKNGIKKLSIVSLAGLLVSSLFAENYDEIYKNLDNEEKGGLAIIEHAVKLISNKKTSYGVTGFAKTLDLTIDGIPTPESFFKAGVMSLPKKEIYIYYLNTNKDYVKIKTEGGRKLFKALNVNEVVNRGCNPNGAMYKSFALHGNSVTWIFLDTKQPKNSFAISIDKEACDEVRKIFR